MSHPADVVALSSHATVIEVDVVLHCGAGVCGCRRVHAGGARVRELGECAVERRGWGVDRDRRHNGDRRFRRRRGGGKVGNPQCSDGIDNDGDGKIDYADPECVGGLDNDESSYATGIPGDNVDACKQDCFFDGNSGMGDDGCMWQLKCDPMNTNAQCPYDQNYAHPARERVLGVCVAVAVAASTSARSWFRTAVTASAAAQCRARRRRSGWLRRAPRRTSAIPTKCPPCTQVTQCMTPCGHCDYCIGKETLPADCTTDGGTPYTLPDRLHRLRTVRHRPDDVPGRHGLRDRLLPADRS